MSRPVHFEIHAEDPERVQRFYGELFGWTFQSWNGPTPYWMIDTGSEGPGINGGLIKRMGPNPDAQEPTPVVGYVCTVDVDDVDGYVGKATGLGGVVALPKMAIPGIGWLAYCKDTESNVFGLMQNDPSGVRRFSLPLVGRDRRAQHARVGGFSAMNTVRKIGAGPLPPWPLRGLSLPTSGREKRRA